MTKTKRCRTFSETLYETLLGNTLLVDVTVSFVVNQKWNLAELPHSWDSDHENLDQREHIGRQPIAQHRLHTFGQSAAAMRGSKTVYRRKLSVKNHLLSLLIALNMLLNSHTKFAHTKR